MTPPPRPVRLPSRERRRDAPLRESALLAAAQAAKDRLAFLGEASRLLASSLEPGPTLEHVCRLLVPRVADWCVVDLLEGAHLALAACAAADPAVEELLGRMRRLYPAQPAGPAGPGAADDGRARLIEHVDEAALSTFARTRAHLGLLRGLGAGSLIVVPLKAQGTTLGLLTLGATAPRRFGPPDSQLAEVFGLRAAAAIANARLFTHARRAEATLQRALAAARMVAWELDLSTGEATRGEGEDALGLPSRFSRRQFLEWVHPDDRARYRLATRRALAARGSYQCAFRLQRPDTRQTVWVEDHGSYVDGPAGERRVCGVLADITGAREATASLERQREEQEIILDSVDAMVWYKDDNNVIVRCNKAAARWAGLPQRRIEGRSAGDLFPRAEAQAFQDQDAAVLRSGQAVRGEVVEAVTPGGERRWVRRDRIPLRDGRGRGRVIVCAVDITELKRAEEVMKASERSQREFFANVSHELRTPVTAIKGFAEALRDGGLRDPRRRGGFLRAIERNAERLSWLIEDVLTLSFLASEAPFELRSVEVSPLVDDLLQGQRAAARARNISLSGSVPPGLKVRAAAPYLAQALEHLVGNALSAARPGGRVAVGARAAADRVVLSVRDDGARIAPAEAAAVFTPFSPARRAGGPGAGLGLAVARKIVERHGGRLWAESAPGRGAAFHASLPAA